MNAKMDLLGQFKEVIVYRDVSTLKKIAKLLRKDMVIVGLADRCYATESVWPSTKKWDTVKLAGGGWTYGLEWKRASCSIAPSSPRP